MIAIAVGKAHSLALRRDGTVFGWGYNRNGEATGAPTEQEPHISRGLVSLQGLRLTNITAIAAGEQYSLALCKDGTVRAWGNRVFYRDPPSNLTNVVAIAAGESYCLAIQKP